MRQVVKIQPELKTITPDEITSNNICLLVHLSQVYHLNRVTTPSNKYAFVDLAGSLCWANGSFSSIKEGIESALSFGDVYVFDSLKEMAQFIVERS